MLEHLLLPGDVPLALAEVTIGSDNVTIDLTTTLDSSVCPRCGVRASRVHSRYQRTVADLPLLQRPVQLRIHVRRFFCDSHFCGQRTFSEAVPHFLLPYARRTTRLSTEQRQLGLDVGGSAAARLAKRQGMPLSAATVLRLVRRDPVPIPATPRVLGVDDFALRKGRVYGTILVDLEHHRPIDLLPSRDADVFATWLRDHPGIEIISRDRANEYAEGASRGAPNAVQVADRFHLLQNLREALQRVLERYQDAIRTAQEPRADPVQTVEVLPNTPVRTSTHAVRAAASEEPVVQTRQEALQARRREHRLERYTAVHDLHAQGKSIHAIARQLTLSRQTVRRFLRAPHFPERSNRRVLKRKLDPFIPYLRAQLAAGQDNGAALWRALRDDQGYRGARSIVTAWIARHRHLVPVTLSSHTTRRGRRPGGTTAPAPRKRSARQIAWGFMRRREQISAEEQAIIERLSTSIPALKMTYTLSQAFLTLMRTHDEVGLDGWITQAATSGIIELQSLAQGIRRDEAAVRAAVTLPWSNGQVEGQVNRLKLIKRMGYGRANFDLLRQRVLAT